MSFCSFSLDAGFRNCPSALEGSNCEQGCQLARRPRRRGDGRRSHLVVPVESDRADNLVRDILDRQLLVLADCPTGETVSLLLAAPKMGPTT